MSSSCCSVVEGKRRCCVRPFMLVSKEIRQGSTLHVLDFDVAS